MKKSLLVVDDKETVCQSLARNFNRRGYHTLYASTGHKALHLFSKHHVDAVLLDVMLGEEDGLAVLDALRRHNPVVPVIMVAGNGSIASAVQSIKLGAIDYITKPLDFEKLLATVERATLRVFPHFEKMSGTAAFPAPHIITKNNHMIELCRKAERLAHTDLPILITGENGTGKEVLADFIHRHSTRSEQTMLKINCAAFPETLLDNELFGHERGAYTGAEKDFRGVFERAHNSSLFLDEIGDMPLMIQAKILRTLQHHEIRRIGGEQTIHVNVRFLAATNKDIEDLLKSKNFREDLYYRLNTAMLHLPPLRERKEDIPALTTYFLAEDAGTHAMPAKTISEQVLERFLDYHWPGNVRELKNAIHYAAAISTTAHIGTDDLPPHFQRIESKPISENIREDTEKTLILKALQRANNNKTKAAEFLKMSRKTLYNKLGKYGILAQK